jgi:alpha-ketoglutarate-dependent taurine dioxygenase
VTPSLKIEPVTGATLGARVSGVDLACLDDSTFRKIEYAWHTHGVLVFEGQHLADGEQVSFSRHFGELAHPLPGPTRVSSARAELTTNLDKTMFQEACATTSELKSSVSPPQPSGP